ncbi:MAG: hypothetical protein WDO68_13700 [Gammaproteobacteria bacterium]
MTTAKIPTIVLGGTGYVAGELLRLIAGHPNFELAAIMSDSQPGELVGKGVSASGRRVRRHEVQVAGRSGAPDRGSAAIRAVRGGPSRRLARAHRLAAEAGRSGEDEAASRGHLR